MRKSKSLCKALFLFCLLIVIGSCKKDPPKTLPTVSTSSISNITQTTATAGGTVSDDGNSPVTARGVCWSTNENPTVSDKKSTDGSGKGSFTSQLSELNPGYSYYVRAYATNELGTSYGNTQSFSASINLPTIKTIEPNGITKTSANSGGIIISNGGSEVIAKGVCWSTDSLPSITESKTIDGKGNENFSSSIINLEEASIYYVRAYATNSAGTAYGETKVFGTDFNGEGLFGASSVTQEELDKIPFLSPGTLDELSFTSMVNVKSSDLPARVMLDFPTPGRQKLGDCSGWATAYAFLSYVFKQVNGNQGYNKESLFSPSFVFAFRPNKNKSEMSLLSAMEVLKERGSCPISIIDTSINTLSYIPSSSDIKEALKYKLSSIYQVGNDIELIKKCIAYGNPVVAGIIVDGVSFIYKYVNNRKDPIDGYVFKKNMLNDLRSHSVCICGYDDSIRAFKIINSWGKTWADGGYGWLDYDFLVNNIRYQYGLNGIIVMLFVGFVERPYVTTNYFSNIQTNSVIINGQIKSDRGHSIIEKGISFGTKSNPTLNNTKIVSNSTTATFSVQLTNLNPNTQYYAKAYAINKEGVAYGNEISFRTLEGGTSPVAAFTASSTSINLGQTIQFTDQSTGNPTSWSWDFGDGGASTIQNPSYTYTKSGSYNVSLAVNNSTGSNSISKTNFITVTDIIGILFNPNLTYGTVTDIDGNKYKTIQIGTKVWMAENLKVTKLNDGTAISFESSNNSWMTKVNPLYCWYNNDIENKNTYGALYNRHTVNTGKLCPIGWHVSTDSNWSTLTNNTGGDNNAAIKLKEAGNGHWSGASSNSTNSSGFTALPGGIRYENGAFSGLKDNGTWWCTNPENYAFSSWYRQMFYNANDIQKYGLNFSPQLGLSVRCVKD